MNRVLPELFGRGEEEMFERLRAPEAEPGSLEPRRPAAAVRPVLDAAELAVQLRRTPGRAPRHAARRRCRPTLPMLYVPELFTRSHGRAAHVAGWPRRSAEELS